MLAMEAVALGDPSAGLQRNSTTLFRSVASHTVMTLAMLLSFKKAIRLSDTDYSLVRAVALAALVGVALEVVWLPFMVLWQYPVPFREFLGLVPFGALVVAGHWLFARDVMSAQWTKVQTVLPIMGAQLALFYVFLGLSIGFACIPVGAQVAMILVLPVVKVFMKKWLWRFAQRLDDLSTDVTICMHVQSRALGVLILVIDVVQAVIEVRLYASHEYVADHRSTLHTAVKIVENALLPGVQQVDKPLHNKHPTPAAVVRSPTRWCVRKTSAKVHSLGHEHDSKADDVVAAAAHAKAMHQAFEAAAYSVLISPQSVTHNHTRKQLFDLGSLVTSVPVPPAPESSRPRTSPLLVPGSIQIDGIAVERRDQARVLEHSLQLLFSCEVLIFVEFMEVLLPVVYGVYVGVAWHLPNAKYNDVLMHMTHSEMIQAVASSLVYACLEAISLAMMCYVMESKYGVKPLHQLAFVLEKYWMTLHGKLIGAFVTIVNSATVHKALISRSSSSTDPQWSLRPQQELQW